jgi:hypothetical protein
VRPALGWVGLVCGEDKAISVLLSVTTDSDLL